MTGQISHFITRLEGNLKAAVELRETEKKDNWLMVVKLVYDGNAVGIISFNLHGYKFEEAEQVAANIGDDPYLMKEIDDLLWGESD